MYDSGSDIGWEEIGRITGRSCLTDMFDVHCMNV